MKKVREGLYIGSMEDAKLYLSGDKRGITHMLSLEKVRRDRKTKRQRQLSKLQQVLLQLERPDPVYDNVSAELAAKCPSAIGRPLVKIVPLKDIMEEDLLGCLDSCLDFINEGRRQGIVLVHCGAGISRSGAIVTAYLMRKEKLSLDDALESLRKSSPQVSPNDGFMQQLRKFEGKRSRQDELEPCEARESKRMNLSPELPLSPRATAQKYFILTS